MIRSEVRDHEVHEGPPAPVVAPDVQIGSGDVAEGLLVHDHGLGLGGRVVQVVHAGVGHVGHGAELEEPGQVVERSEDRDGQHVQRRPDVVLQPEEWCAYGHIPF